MSTRIADPNENYQCTSCGRITKCRDLARLPDSGGWVTLACPHCKSESIKRLKKEVNNAHSSANLQVPLV